MVTAGHRDNTGALDDAAANRAQPLDAVFGALSDPIRRGMLARLTQGSCSVTELGEPFPVSAPAISKHLSVLERSGLIERWKVGRVHFCRLIAAPLQEAGNWIEQQHAFWERQLDALEDYLDRDEETCRGPLNQPAGSFTSDGGFARRRKKFSAPGRNRKR
ncbi:MAG: helix-turn-helix transcriptional regulator [Alphaproteobacteria bacterium]|nr:helix-turn-helix transcriptional regulator [Alphaproteobacteria bacterium]